MAAVTGVFLLRRANFDNRLSRFRDALALVLFGGLGSATVSASIGTFALHSSKVHAYSGLGSAWLIYWLGDSTGVLLITPLVLTLPSLFRIRGWSRLAELVSLLVILVAVCTVVFYNFTTVPVRMLSFAILPIVIWAAVRFGVSGAAVSMFVVATVATLETALGSGPFAVGTPFGNAVHLDAFYTVFSLTGLTLATLYAERERAEEQRAQSLRKQVAMEVRLQDEERLRVSEERLRLAQKAARIGTFERDLRTGMVTWSTELELMYGLSPGEFDGTATTFFEKLIHPEDRDRVKELQSIGLQTGEPTNGEWRVIWPDGSVHWIAGHWQVLSNESGEPVRVIGVNRDVTERKRAEEALLEMNRTLEAQGSLLRSREELLRAFVKSVPAAVAMLDRELRYLQVSDRWCSDNSVEASEVLGRPREGLPKMPER